LCQTAADLGYLDRMLLSRVENIGFPGPNDLSDSREPAERRRIQDAIPISFELLALILLYGPIAAPQPVEISPHEC
jgi:hypothetical protein